MHSGEVGLLDIEFIEVMCRLMIAMLFSGLVGIDREKKDRPAGFKTYILVGIGAALVMIINQKIVEEFGVSDPVRLGAQVISGVGFLGAGTIMVTGGEKVKGLTTAAGLWVVACMGLAIGAGFYQVAIAAFICIFATLKLLHLIGNKMSKIGKISSLYLEISNTCVMKEIIDYLQTNNIRILNIEVNDSLIKKEGHIGVIIKVKFNEKYKYTHLEDLLKKYKYVEYVFEWE